MRTVPTTKRHSNPNVRRAVVPFTKPTPRTLERRTFHTYKLHTSPADPDSPIYELSIPFFNKGLAK
eukprot:2419651-Ditylum_brightwellii.AAC.1